jgi:hypothetical protein
LWVWGQPGLHNKTVSQKNLKQKKKKRKKETTKDKRVN